MKYRKIHAYKYELLEKLEVKVPELEVFTITHRFFTLLDGVLTIMSGYAWDGPSGPTLDDRTNIQPSLVHDVLYQAIREGLLPAAMRKTTDRIFRRLCVEKGMPTWRAWYYYYALKWFGASSAKKRREHVSEVWED